MTRTHCDWCDKIIAPDETESRHYKRKDYRIVVEHEGEALEVCRVCIGEIFFNLKPEGKDKPK